MFKFSFEKNGKCTNLDKKRIKKELKNIRKRKCQLFLEIGCNVLEIVGFREELRLKVRFKFVKYQIQVNK